MRGCNPGNIDMATASTNSACTKPISAPNHQFARRQLRTLLRDGHTTVEDRARTKNLSDNGNSHHGPRVGVRR